MFDVVMRSLYLNAGLDAMLTQVSEESGRTKSDLVNAALSAKLAEWTSPDGDDAFSRDMDEIPEGMGDP